MLVSPWIPHKNASKFFMEGPAKTDTLSKADISQRLKFVGPTKLLARHSRMFIDF